MPHTTPRINQGAVAGFTLIELLLVVTCLSIALGLSAAPFAARLAEIRSESAMLFLANLINLSRQEAILRGRPVTLCALDTDSRCHREWTNSHRVAVFIDTNRDRRLGPAEPLIREARWPMTQGELLWRASLARPYIEFEQTGATWQNGTLVYCPASRDARQARALVLSHSGRAYLPGDSNGDGIREDRSGKNLRC
ncbi:MAG: hypothetical protein Cons2KO_06600 [Congregibacter sp.]